MDGQEFIAFADRLKRQTRDVGLIRFLDHAILLARKQAPKQVKFDRATYQREYMREYRKKERELTNEDRAYRDGMRRAAQIRKMLQK